MAPAVTLVVSGGSGSMEVLGTELARRLPVDRLDSDRYRPAAETFNPTVPQAVCSAIADIGFVRALRRCRGLIHFPHHHFARYGPLTGRPFVVTVHDLIRHFDRARPAPLIHRPNRIDRTMLNLDLAGIRHASAIIAISHTTKRDLVAQLGVAPERIRVIYPGIDLTRFRPVAGESPDPYVLFVGSEQPRKNLASLLTAFALLKRRRGHSELRLIKVGDAGGTEGPFRAQTLRTIAQLGIAADVELLERVPHERLVELMSGARCLVQPSLYEGFGLPPLEAMACGCPVIVSDRGALPETAGAAAIISPPAPDPLCDQMERVLGDRSLRARLRHDGIAHVRGFDWVSSAAETLSLYRSLAAA